MEMGTPLFPRLPPNNRARLFFKLPGWANGGSISRHSVPANVSSLAMAQKSERTTDVSNVISRWCE